MLNTHELLCQSPSYWMLEMRPVLGPLWVSEHGGSERWQGRQVRPSPSGAKAWPGHLHSSRPPLGGRVTTVQTEDCTTPGAPCPRLTSKTILLNFPWKRVPREAQPCHGPQPQRDPELPTHRSSRQPLPSLASGPLGAQGQQVPREEPAHTHPPHFPPTLPGATTFRPLILSQLHY